MLLFLVGAMAKFDPNQRFPLVLRTVSLVKQILDCSLRYFFASAPGNPILKRCLQLVRQRYTWKVQAPQDLTGRAAVF